VAIQQFVKAVPSRPVALALVADWIVDIVTERAGIKETDLLLDILSDIDGRVAMEDVLADVNIEMVYREIQRLIQQGRIVGVDCQIGDGGYTFLLPLGAKVHMIVPSQERPTRH
jgi:hypothetical protein